MAIQPIPAHELQEGDAFLVGSERHIATRVVANPRADFVDVWTADGAEVRFDHYTTRVRRCT